MDSSARSRASQSTPAPEQVSAGDALADRRFVAFISYRHTTPDRQVAEWLQGALERFSIPRRLRTDTGAKRIGKVFRDDEELAASHSLGSAIEEALRRSSFLIVVCSPRTPDSRWVNAEISYFQQLGRANRILPVLIEGTPEASFPDALVGNNPSGSALGQRSEPFAADLREQAGDSRRARRRFAKLRLIAPILGCGFDELRYREQERRVRTATLTGVVLAAILAIVATLAVIAYARGNDIKDALATAYWNQARSPEDLDPLSRLHLSSRALDVAHSSLLRTRIAAYRDSHLPPFVLVHSLPLMPFEPEPYSADSLTAFETTDKDLTVVNVRTGTIVAGKIQHLHNSLDGRQLLLNGARLLTWGDGEVRLWDVSNGRQLGSTKRFDDTSDQSPSVDESSNRFLTWGREKLTVWSAVDGRLLAKARMPEIDDAEFEDTGVIVVEGAKWHATLDAKTLRAARPASANRRSTGQGERSVHDRAPWTKGYSAGDTTFGDEDEYIAAWSKSGSFRVWETASKRPISREMRHGSEIDEIRFVGGQLIASVGGGNVRLWDFRNGDEVGDSPMRHDRWHEEYDEDEDLVERRNPHPLVSPTGNRFVTWTEQGTALLWALSEQNGKRRRVTKLAEFGRPHSHYGLVSGATFDATGERLLTWTDDNDVRLWDAHSGRQLGSTLLHGWGVAWAMFSGDGRRILSYDGRRLRIWARRGFNFSTIATGPGLQRVVPIPELRQVVSLSTDGRLRWWDIDRAQLVRESEPGVRRIVALTGANRILVEETSALTELDAGTGERSPHAILLPEPPVGVSTDRSNRTVATWDSSGTVAFWDLASGRRLRPPLKHHSQVSEVWLAARGKRVLTYADGDILYWGSPRRPPVRMSLESAESGLLPTAPDASHVELDSTGTRVLVHAHDRVLLFDARTGSLTGTIRHGNFAIVGATFSQDGRRVLSWAMDSAGTARVSDAISGTQIGEAMSHDTHHVAAASFAANESRVVTLTMTGEARVWDASTHAPVARPVAPADGAFLMRDAAQLVTWTPTEARLTEIPSGLLELAPMGHFNITDMMSLGSTELLSIADDGTLRVWHSRHDGATEHSGASIETVVFTGTELDESGLAKLVPPQRWRSLRAQYCSGRNPDPASCAAVISNAAGANR